MNMNKSKHYTLYTRTPLRGVCCACGVYVQVRKCADTIKIAANPLILFMHIMHTRHKCAVVCRVCSEHRLHIGHVCSCAIGPRGRLSRLVENLGHERHRLPGF
jgi:hypothetical protein